MVSVIERLWPGSDAANLGGGLTDALPVGSLDQYLRRARRFNDDALWNGVTDRVREAQRQVQCLAGDRGAKPYAHQFEFAIVTTCNADDHVRQVSARRASTRACLALIGVAHLQLLVFLCH